MLIFNYGHRIALFDIKYPRFLKMDKKMSNFKIHKNFPNTFFAFLYNKLKKILKAENILFNNFQKILNNSKIYQKNSLQINLIYCKMRS